jgi:uncharacterized protein
MGGRGGRVKASGRAAGIARTLASSPAGETPAAAAARVTHMEVGAPDFMAVFAGGLVGLILGVIGGGGSILAVPLLVYVVGVQSPHLAIGTSAIAVALSALANLINHARRDHVCWPVAILFAVSGVVGAALGSTLGKHTDGQKLLVLFGVLMVAVAASMAMQREGGAKQHVRLERGNAPRIIGIGFAVGALSGFFGIGGGFLVVPGLVAATSMSMIVAIGSSLVSVTAFGLTTAVNYALSDLIDWRLVLLFVAGGIVGGLAGGRLATALATQKRALSIVFAAVVATVGTYVAVRGMLNLLG